MEGEYNGKESVVGGDDDCDRGIEGSVTIESHERGEQADGQGQTYANQIFHSLFLAA